MKILVYKAKDGDWHIRVSGKNNRVLLDASGYNTKRNALVAIKTVLKYAVAGNYTIK